MNLNFFLLDGAQGLIIIPILFLLHVGLTLLIEGSILRKYDYGTRGKCFTDAFIINLCSLIIGLFLISPISRLTYNFDFNYTWDLIIRLGIFYIQTVICEGLLLRVLNRSFPLKDLISATLIMNAVTYVALFLILQLIG